MNTSLKQFTSPHESLKHIDGYKPANYSDAAMSAKLLVMGFKYRALFNLFEGPDKVDVKLGAQMTSSTSKGIYSIDYMYYPNREYTGLHSYPEKDDKPVHVYKVLRSRLLQVLNERIDKERALNSTT